MHLISSGFGGCFMVYVLFWAVKCQVDVFPTMVCFCARSIHLFWVYFLLFSAATVGHCRPRTV